MHSCRFPDSASQGVVFRLRISLRIWSQNRNCSKCSVRDLCRTDLCKNPRKSASLPCPFQGLTNEKRDGFKVVAFERSPFKLFTRRFSNKSVQAPSCERPKTAQRTLFLSFEINNCHPITVQCRAESPFSHHTFNWNNGIVLPPRYLKRRKESALHHKSFQITQ